MGLFGAPKINTPPVVDPSQTQNRINDALTRQLMSGGTNADVVNGSGGALGAPMSAPRVPTLTGLN